ncbi:MAG TPA: hypothetical protein VGS41_18735 [Chthonomonadales bacterium]|nr:hypothetical protein [Chthonomonadales bacterium]
MSRYVEYNLSEISPQLLAARQSKVKIEQLAQPPEAGATFAAFMESLPQILAGEEIRRVATRIAEARLKGRSSVVACGGHVVKCGVAPVLIRLMERGFITALAMNGAVAIHDIEIALCGATSEDVPDGLRSGTFGMSHETAAFYNSAIDHAVENNLGAGEAIGKMISASDAPFKEWSLLARAYRSGVPATVHIAIGTDIVHMHPAASGAALGEASMRDFRILTAAMENLADGGVLMNIGSAVILPEVLLKAIAILRNTRSNYAGLFGVNMDFMQQYRSNQQVVVRVKEIGGDGASLTGHHEIMVPLLGFAIEEVWARFERQ